MMEVLQPFKEHIMVEVLVNVRPRRSFPASLEVMAQLQYYWQYMLSNTQVPSSTTPPHPPPPPGPVLFPSLLESGNWRQGIPHPLHLGARRCQEVPLRQWRGAPRGVERGVEGRAPGKELAQRKGIVASSRRAGPPLRGCEALCFCTLVL
jgi:hypothetical protein